MRGVARTWRRALSGGTVGVASARGALLAGTSAGLLVVAACTPTPAAPRAAPAAPSAPAATTPSAPVTAPAPAEESVSFAYPSPSISWLPLLIAERQGFFAEERLIPRPVQMTPATNVVAVLAGDIDFGLGLTSVAQAAVQQDAPIRGIMALAVRPQHRLMVRPEIASFADLRGKVVAINSHSDITDWEVRVILQRNGIPLEDVSIQAIPSSPSRLAGLDAGQLAAAIMASPFDLQSEALGHRELGRISREIEIAWMGVSASQRTLAERRELTRRTLRAILRGLEYTRTQRDAVLRLMPEALEMEPAAAASAYALGLDTWSEDGTASDEAWRNTLEIARLAGPVPADVPIERYVERAVLEEARQSLPATR
jgi:ABC-type nitrate/sulfonate/bicarbonate transport system substrate-binding protein